MARSVLAPPLFGDPSNPLSQGAPTPADAWQYNAPALADAWRTAQTPDFWTDAAQQYGSALLAGTTAPGAARMAAVDPLQHMLEQIAASPKSKWGIRITPDPIATGTGEVLPPSRIWDDGTPTDRTLPGTSAVGINGTNRKAIEDALAQAGVAPYGKPYWYYHGQHVTLVKGESWRKGTDDGERLMSGARAVSAYRKADDGPSHLLPLPEDGGDTQ